MRAGVRRSGAPANAAVATRTLAPVTVALYGSRVNLLHDLPLFDEGGHVNVVVEVPRGSEVKLKYDADRCVFVWSRPMSLGICYPYDFGFLPQTLAGDGDAVDAVVFAEVASYPGVVVPSRVIGALRVEQEREGQPIKRNDRLIMVPLNAHRRSQTLDIGGVPPRILAEIEAFFAASLMLTGKAVRFCGWAAADEAAELIAEAHARYLHERKPTQ